MLTIRNAQIRVLRLQRELAFAAALLPYLRQRALPLRELPDATVRRRIIAASRRARQRGIGLRESVVEFILLTFELAPRFDEHPAVARLLSGSLTSNTAIHLVRDRLTQAEWDAIHSHPVLAVWPADEIGE